MCAIIIIRMTLIVDYPSPRLVLNFRKGRLDWPWRMVSLFVIYKIEFLKALDSKYPKENKICLVYDTLKVHTSEATRRYLSTVPGRFEFVFTPKNGSWLNMIEGIFYKMTKQMLREIWVKSKEELKERIYKYFDEINEEPEIFHWKYNLDGIDVSEEVIVDTLSIKKSS